ncbi:MAG TPA: hypothetical protein VEH29_13010 [Acidimicrobiales bacterium]|nr:hypothetical protein [Acidimicrobiales bacterium]
MRPSQEAPAVAARRARAGERALAPLLVVVLLSAWLTTTARAAAASPATHAARISHARAHTGARHVSAAYSYDLVTAVGGVYNFGGAGWYGEETSQHLSAPIVGMAVTPDGRGYWLVGANGAVFNLGDAGWYGSLASDVLGDWQQIIAIVATADGKGYWLIDESGSVTAFGDAGPINGGQPLPPADLATPIVSAAIAPGGIGAWFTDSAGHVYVTGEAPWLGAHVRNHVSPITSIAAAPSGLGYWLADAAGQVWGYGDVVAGAAAPEDLDGTVVGMIPAENRLGYWVATSAGAIISGGDAKSRSGPAGALAAVVGIAAAPQVDPAPLPPDAVGYDVNWPQCQSPGSSEAGTLPGPPTDASGSTAYSIAVIGVDGWAFDDDNSCLAAEVAWAQQAVYPAGSSDTGTPPYDLYLFLNSPASDATADQSGPAGTCSNLSGAARKTCLAYNYGYNSAVDAVSYAASQGAHSQLWWLDIENDTCARGEWNDEAHGEWWSCDSSLNAETIQGALDALRFLDITPGIYCTSVQWAGITGGYVPTGGAPLIWIAGAPWTSPPYPKKYGYPKLPATMAFCTESQYWFAGGSPVMLQETPGPSGYPFDPDVAC